MDKAFLSRAAANDDPILSGRLGGLYPREGDVRNAYQRDYTRILHSYAFRRLKHKTQVFFNVSNDHICTRMEHVLHVESISTIIAGALGLNADLTKAIALGHDLGHAPFGHRGEEILRELCVGMDDFWHERHGLYIADKIELLEDSGGVLRNLDLTFAVRDGILCHCGEIDENNVRPRERRADDLSLYSDRKTQPQPMTWEGCVMKVSDKIAYLGRDINDALQLDFISDQALKELSKLLGQPVVNNTVTIHSFISDVINNSSPEAGICLSGEGLRQLNELRNFNQNYIYANKRFNVYGKYCYLVLTEIYSALMEAYDNHSALINLQKLAASGGGMSAMYRRFMKWLSSYISETTDCVPLKKHANDKIYGLLDTETLYRRAVIDYISSMTDRFAVETFEGLISYW